MADDSDTPLDPKDAPPTGNVNSNAKQALSNTFNNGPLDSKKWLAMMIGLSCVMFIFIGTMLAIVFTDATKAPSYISLANMAVVFIGMMVSVLLTGQSAVEWKTSSTLGDMHNTEVKAAVETNNTNAQSTTHTIEDRNVNIHLSKELQAHIQEEGKGAPDLKPFGMDATDDDDGVTDKKEDEK